MAFFDILVVYDKRVFSARADIQHDSAAFKAIVELPMDRTAFVRYNVLDEHLTWSRDVSINARVALDSVARLTSDSPPRVICAECGGTMIPQRSDPGKLVCSHCGSTSP